MIRASNIDKVAHTADFRCDEHDAYKLGVNLNTDISYSDDSGTIVVPGNLLTSGADAGIDAVINTITCYPTVGGNELAQDLAEAKTA